MRKGCCNTLKAIWHSWLIKQQSRKMGFQKSRDPISKQIAPGVHILIGKIRYISTWCIPTFNPSLTANVYQHKRKNEVMRPCLQSL